MGGSSDDLRHLPNFGEERNNNPEWQKVKLLLSSCFNFSCEGNVLLDDENISCLEDSPEMKRDEASSNREVSDSVVCDDENGHGVLSCITSPEIHSTDYLTQNGSSAEWEKNKLYPDIKKQSGKNYNSFESSPPLDEITDTKEASMGSPGLLTASDELRPLISKYNSMFYKNDGSVTNEYDCVAKKDKFYNKVLPFPIMSKSFGSPEYSGAVNSLVKFDDDTNSHSVSLNYSKDMECKGNNFSVFQKPVIAKDTMILCNDLDSDCQVIPLSFSPNVHPDMGLVPPVNSQVSMNNSVPPGTLVSSSCNSNSLVTLLNQTKDSTHPASWPRRRPQSLRVAMCYSDPEHLQASLENPSPVVNLQEIALEDMSTNSLKDCFSRKMNILSSPISFNSLAVQDESKLKCPLNENPSEKQELSSEICRKDEDRVILRDTKPDDGNDDTAISTKDNVLQASDVCKESFNSVTETSHTSNSFTNASQRHVESEDWGLKSPSSDKENDPTILSVRPKIKSINTSHSPKKKKMSPLKKHKSPRKHKPDVMKEVPSKSLSPQKCENINKKDSLCSREEDVWAVDDFLPIKKHHHSQCVEQLDKNSKSSPTLTVKNSLCGLEVKSGSKSENVKGNMTPFFDDTDFSMVNSTFSTDTGYETETNVNSVSGEDCVTVDEVPKSKEISTLHSMAQRSIVPDVNSSLCVPSAHSTPINLSGPATPNTVTDDLTEYYSICSELTNLINVSNNISLQKEAGDDTPDYLSISSELPGVSKLLEDSPSADLDMQQCFVEDNKNIELAENSSRPDQASHSWDSQDSPSNREPSAAIETPVDQDPPSPTEKEKTPSDSSLPSPVNTPSQELVEVKYVQLSLSIVLAIVLHAMQSISQFMLEIFLATEQDDRWD